MTFDNLIPREQRHEVYKQLLKEVCEDPKVDYGLCLALVRLKKNKLTRKLGSKLFSIHYFPELYSHKKEHGMFWAPLTQKGWEKRIKWIQQAIKDTK